MRVRIISDTVDHVRRYRSGDEVDLSDEQASRWIAAGLALPAATPPESTVAPPAPETTTQPAPRRYFPTKPLRRGRGRKKG